MSQKRRKNKSNLYENDFEDLIYTTDEFVEPIKTKHLPQQKKKQKETPIKASASSKNSRPAAGSFEVISKKSVQCKCNKCQHSVVADLINYLFCPLTRKAVPFVRYTCTSCGHTGNRSVLAKSMPINEFETYYFN